MEKRVLPSGSEYLLEFMDTIPSDSDDEFGGYLSEDEDNEDDVLKNRTAHYPA